MKRKPDLPRHGQNTQPEAERTSQSAGKHTEGTEPRRPGRRRASARFFLRLALKNLSRYRRRTAVTATAIAMGVAAFVAMDSLLVGFGNEGERNLANYEVGSAAIAAPGYWDDRDRFPLDNPVERPEEFLAELDNAGIPAAPRTSFRGEVIVRYDPYPEDGSSPATFHGIDPERDPAVFNFDEAIVEGRFPVPGEDEILISKWLAERLGAEVGFPLTLTTRTRDGYRQLMDLDIVGLYQTSNPTVDRSHLFLPLETADEDLEMRGAVTTIHLRLPEQVPGTADLGPVEQLLRETGRFAGLRENGNGGGDQDAATTEDPVTLLSFGQMTQEFAEFMELEHAGSDLILFLLAIIAVVGISNTMLMAVLEREHEIGMMRAMGVHKREITRLFSYEAAVIGLIGALGGIVLASIVNWFLVTNGVNFGQFLEGTEMDLRFDGILYGVWNYGTMVTAAIFAAVLAGVVALIPTRRILRRKVADSLRHG